jgi:hypothetical protein
MNISKFIAHQAHIKNIEMDGVEVLNVIKDPSMLEVDEPTYAKVKNIEFKNGTIEVDVYSKLLPDAPDYARGFIGVAFRINENDSQYESIYIRPTNGRCDDQIRRNHSVQYYAYPDHKFNTLRVTSPEKYESYADMGLHEWIKMKIVVDDLKAELYLNDSKYPVLVVNDLKNGLCSGGIALWSEVGTDAYFRNLKITQSV